MFSPDEAAFLDAWAACSGEASSPHTSTPRSPSHTLHRSTSDTSCGCQGSAWSREEHELFLEAMRLHPTGPWKAIADHIGTRTPRQARSHAQKHKEKLHRRQRKLQRMQSYLVVDPHTSNVVHSHGIRRQGIPWTPTEDSRLGEAMQMYPQGPWRSIAAHVGTRSVRQVMSYGQKKRLELVILTHQVCDESQLAVTETLLEDVEYSDALHVPSMDELVAEDLPCLKEQPTTDDLLHWLLLEDDLSDILQEATLDGCAL